MAGPFGSLGTLHAGPDISPADFARALEGRAALVLAPASARGWFDGRALVAWDPTAVADALDIAEASEALEHAFSADKPELSAALLTYESAATIARFSGALVLAEDGWRSWGELPADAAAVAAAAAAAVSEPPPVGTGDPLILAAEWDLSGREFRAAVEQVRERIAAGDVYVLNLTARFEGAPAVSAAVSFAALQARAASDMSAAFLGLTGASRDIVSVSPERFLRVRRNALGERTIEVCPIKGTAPRGSGPQADAESARALASDEKERAEHVMVVDLERNDIGVVCVPATVDVDPLYAVVPTPYCHQLVSTVHGVLRAESSVRDVLAATFPCGSVTGAPKRAAVRIASELERTTRGAYCGALVVAVPGEIDSAVLIRTLEFTAEERASWGAGCGITFESHAAAEYLEALLKASPVTGDGVPAAALRETMRVVGGRVPLMDRHLARLAAGGCGPTLLAQVREAASVALKQGESVTSPGAYARLGITVTADGSVSASVTYDPSSLDVPGGPRIAMVEVERLPELPRQAAKPAARSYWDRAHRLARMRGADQAVLATAEGGLVDGSTATVWLLLDGVLATPLAPPAVAGIMREVVFDAAGRLGIQAEERPLSVADLERADEVFLGNAVGGVVPARDRGGEVTRRIAEAVSGVFSEG